MGRTNLQMNTNATNKGFSLVETLVAVSILSLTIAGTFTAVQKGLQSSSYAKDQVTAFYLAQDGMEFIKNVRDENALNSIGGGANKWLTGLSDLAGDPCFFGKVCTVDSNVGVHNGGVVSCGGTFGTCPNLRQDSVTGLVGYNAGWTVMNFKREIQFQPINSDEVLVIIRMSWTSRGINKSFQITETLFNRQ